MTGQRPKRSGDVRRDHAIAAIASGATFEEAASAARVSGRTLRRWRAEPSFQAALRRAMRASRSKLIETIERSAGRAVDLVTRMLEHGSARQQMRAAELILVRSVMGDGGVTPAAIKRAAKLIASAEEQRPSKRAGGSKR